MQGAGTVRDREKSLISGLVGTMTWAGRPQLRRKSPLIPKKDWEWGKGTEWLGRPPSQGHLYLNLEPLGPGHTLFDTPSFFKKKNHVCLLFSVGMAGHVGVMAHV